MSLAHPTYPLHQSSSLSRTPLLTFLNQNDVFLPLSLESSSLFTHLSQTQLSPFSLFSTCLPAPKSSSACIITFPFSVLFIAPLSSDPPPPESLLSFPLISLFFLTAGVCPPAALVFTDTLSSSSSSSSGAIRRLFLGHIFLLFKVVMVLLCPWLQTCYCVILK